ncbi:hybrid sensor histidine kinase/response regulator [Variovorax sp. VNK109]|jgi:signal transduction histidine kinase|uniref:hybrid sensor histidine kinase/response regulator n=1 Tax=Variovorax sp. VNK109 TaxID=3400919 RepID=UPI003BFAF543
MPETPVNILIVDDLQENLLALEALIRSPGRRIHQARSGNEALALLLEHEFALAILDVQMPAMTGFELAELMRGTERTRHIPIVFVTAAGRDLDYAFQGYESGAVDFLYKPLDNYAVQSKVNVFVDLFLQRRAVRDQVEALEEARRLQDELVQQLQETQADLQRAVRMRDDFVSLVSHELRTPLNTLFLEVQMRRVHLGKGDMQALSPKNMEAVVQREERQIQSMVRLIDDMIDVSRLRRGVLPIRYARTQLASVIQRAVDGLAHRSNEAGVDIRASVAQDVEGLWDEFRIEQVISNLLSNAVRHGKGGPVEINAAPANDALGQPGVQIHVRDHGEGIAPGDEERIFGQFERGANQGGTLGMGLGLFIARQLVSAHDGELTLSSNTPQGATFTVWLPLKPRSSSKS